MMESNMVDEHLQYALRVAWLLTQIQRRYALRASESNSEALAISCGVRSGVDLQTFFVREGSRSQRFPERLLKQLDEQLKSIAMGTHSLHREQRIRRTAAVFWANWSDKSYIRRLKESRKVEDLILGFVTASSKTLRKDSELGDDWKEELGKQVDEFLVILVECLQACGQSQGSPLLARLQHYRGELASDDLATSPTATTTVRTMNPAVPHDDPLETALDSLLTKEQREERDWPAYLGSVCSVELALRDIKLCLQSLNTEQPFPWKTDDFLTLAAWQSWKAGEISTLSQLTLAMMQLDPRSVSVGDQTSRDSSTIRQDARRGRDVDQSSILLREDASDSSLQKQFTFIPPDEIQAYEKVLRHCLEYDLQMMATLPEEEEVSVGILSSQHTQLLTECALRWRISRSRRPIAFFSNMLEQHIARAVPFECLQEAFTTCLILSTELNVNFWPRCDIAAFHCIMEALRSFMMTLLDTTLQDLRVYQSAAVKGYASMWNQAILMAVPGVTDAETDPMRELIKSVLRQQAFQLYTSEVSMQFGSDTKLSALEAASNLVDRLLKSLTRRLREPLFDVNMACTFETQVLDLFERDLLMASPSAFSLTQGGFSSPAEALTVWRRLMSLLVRSEQTANLRALASAFRHVVEAWLDETASQTKSWANNALEVDSFEPIDSRSHSSSVTDLFAAFEEASTVLRNLQWPNAPEYAVFVGQLVKAIAATLCQYCANLESAFLLEMRPSDPAEDTSTASGWIAKARSTLIVSTERQPFTVTPKSCVMLNNIGALRERLDLLYTHLDVDSVCEHPGTQVSSDSSAPEYFYSIKIISANGVMRPAEVSAGQLNLYVVLSDKDGNRLAKTRTIPTSSHTRWGQSFDLTGQKGTWLMATIRHRFASGRNCQLGRAYIHLDRLVDSDGGSRDCILSFDTGGQLHLRVDMETVSDDVRFLFGRAFRRLKRVETDMMKSYMDKMMPVVRQSLSRSSLAGLSNRTSLPSEYSQTLNKLSAAYRNAIRDKQLQIPAPDQPRHKGMTDFQIESAIHPLFDYLDSNNHTLTSFLAPTTMQTLMSKLWKEILIAIEDLILPPLSDRPSIVKPLSDSEVDAVLKWLQFLRDFFYADGDSNGVPLETLQTKKFGEILRIRIYYDWSTDDLMEECVRELTNSLGGGTLSVRRGKSVLSQRNLGTMRARTRAKQRDCRQASNGEMLMRILRMRPGTTDFLSQQLQVSARIDGTVT